MTKISIVAPIYNTAKYLRCCVDSVLTQTFTDFELLLIDDGSSDGSEAICDAYATVDRRVRVYHKQNGGVSSARNLGLDLAQGEYVMFLDSDDYWCDATALEQLIMMADTYNLDIVRGEYKAVDANGAILFERPFAQSKIDISHKVITSGVFYNSVICGEHFLFLSLIRKEAIGGMRFNVNRSFLEDMEFYVYLLLQSMRCMFVPFRFYAYRKLMTSASNTPSIRNLMDSFAMCDVFNNCCNRCIDSDLRKAYKYNSVMMYYWTLETMSLDPYYANRSKAIADLKLEKRQRQVSRWASDSNLKCSWLIHLKPSISVLIFRGINVVKFRLSFLKRIILT